MTLRHGLYGIFWNEGERSKAMWALHRNKRQALMYARKLGAYVTRMDLPFGVGGWDAPTFRACSDLIADYRNVNLFDEISKL